MSHAEGGWGYAAEQRAQPEPTCLALLALALDRERHAEKIAAGLKFLQQGISPDGGYRSLPGRDEAVWPTSQVLFTQFCLGAPADQLARTASFLLELRGQTTELAAEEKHVSDIDMSLIGWPWLANTFSWVEPTAWACLVLRRAGHGQHPRVQEGQRMLLNRVLDQGGINYGNRRVFQVMTSPLPIPTALLLLAMQGQTDLPPIARSVAWLRDELPRQSDLENLCWGKLALHAVGADGLDAIDDRIREARQRRTEASWTRPAPQREALSALALGTAQHNCFRLPADLGAPTAIVAVPQPPKPGWGERIKKAFKGVVVNAAGNLRPLPPQTQVHIAPVTNYEADLKDVVCRQYEPFREQRPLKGKRVVIKPNYIEYRPNQAVNTHPNVVAAVIELCKREGAAEVVVAEGPGHWRNTEYVVQASGLGDVLKHYGVRFVDLNHDEAVKVVNLGRATKMEHLWMARTAYSAEVLISLAKLKTHHWAGATLTMKNLFGIMSGICYGWPKNQLHWHGIDASIVDINLTRGPDLAIVDGIIGMEGDGPLAGPPRPLGALIMGLDPLAVDATCCRLMQLNPDKIGYLAGGHVKKMGLIAETQIQQIGERIETLAKPFEPAPLFGKLALGRPA
ncbi:MAG: DUF362 domain-containing protein [Planctomycetia bacterium]|nr:DUF362 domain-containing protein [Planctomycetia bacterium]